MDGNGRWAKERWLPRVEGHRNGAKTVRMVVEESARLGVRYLTLFSFSTENWGRPQDEVGSLMFLFEQYLRSEVASLIENGVRLRAIGDLERLPDRVRLALSEAMKATEEGERLDLILAISYGGREEIVHSARRIAERVRSGELHPADITNADLRAGLYAPDVPDVDLLIRTSDEFRISNFLLWQIAYAEIVVTPTLWPAFSREEYRRCLTEFSSRQRRFGLVAEDEEEIEPQSTSVARGGE